MNRFITVAVVLSMAVAAAAGAAQENFVYPKQPLAPKGAAPSPKVINGTVFESGALELQKASTLVLPENAVVEEHDGPTVRFFLTKSLSCAGHPPVRMHYDQSRTHFGIAQRLEDKAVVVSTFGEWTNRGGSAMVRMLVLVPRGLEYELKEGLHGPTSAASSTFNPLDEALKRCYWYAGHRPKDGWKEIETSLHFNRFLQPR